VLAPAPTTYTDRGITCRTGPLPTARGRLALPRPIDVSEIMKYVLYDQGQRIAGPAYPVLPWYNREYKREYTWRTGEKAGQTEKLEFIPYDIKEAEALLKEEGFEKDSSGTLIKDGKPFRIRLVNSSGQGTRNDIALLARQNWQKLGVRIEYEQYEWNVFIGQYVFPGNFDVVVLGWSGGLSFDKRQLFHSAYTPPRGLNFGGFKNEEADRLMEQILEEYDPEQQAKLSHEIYNYIADDVAYVFLFSPYSTAVMDRRIVWRKEVGKDKSGNPTYENRPVNHDYITSAKQPLKYFVDELKRLDERPDFTEEDRKR
jgi:peptide/nickel transport system substrate-binding protein